MENTQKVARWYFDGMAATLATCITHPLDLIKVLLQTQQGKLSMWPTTVKIINNDGILGLYNGLTASITRQMTYYVIRFLTIDICRKFYIDLTDEDVNMPTRIACASIGAAAGGFIGSPSDMVTVRMQNDVKLPFKKRRMYKHVFDGFWRVYSHGGIIQLFSGASMATSRAFFMTACQISLFGQIKDMLLNVGFGNNFKTDILVNLSANIIGTTITEPLDVLKTRSMNAKAGHIPTMKSVIMHTAKLGPLGFFKGCIPSYIRLGPHTVFTYIFFEQLKDKFGYIP